MKDIAILVGIAGGLWLVAAFAIRFVGIMFFNIPNREMSVTAVSVLAAAIVAGWFWHRMQR
jgi:hypothetical protein